MSRYMRNVMMFTLACLLLSLALSRAAEPGADSYDAVRQRMKDLETMEDKERKKTEYDEIISLHQDNDDAKMQRLVARATRERALLEAARLGGAIGKPDAENALPLLDAMIERYQASKNDGVKAEVAVAKITKADILFWRFTNESDKARSDLYDEIIADIGESTNEDLVRLAAYARDKRIHLVPSAEQPAAYRDFIGRYESSADSYVRGLVAKAMNRLAELVATETEKNSILEKLVAAFSNDDDLEIQSIVDRARKNITDQDSYDKEAVNSFSWSMIHEGKLNADLRRAWLDKNPSGRKAIYRDMIKKYRHVKEQRVQLIIVTALLEQSFLDMDADNADALACMDAFSDAAPDYGIWLSVRQNRLWFVRGRKNILAELDVMLYPGQKNKFNNPDYYFRDASIGSGRIREILEWAEKLRSSLAPPPLAKTTVQSETDASGAGEEMRRLVGRIVNSCGNAPDRYAQYQLSLALDGETASLKEGDVGAFWKAVIERFETGKSVYARHHVITGYARLIAAAEGEEKTALLNELFNRFEDVGIFRELLLLEDIRKGKTDLAMPLLFRDW